LGEKKADDITSFFPAPGGGRRGGGRVETATTSCYVTLCWLAPTLLLFSPTTNWEANWEAKDKAGYLGSVTSDFTFNVQYNAYTPTSGAEATWAFHGFLPNAVNKTYLLWTNTFDSWLFAPGDPYTLNVRMNTFLRDDCTPERYPGFCSQFHPAGSLYQMGRWTVKLDPASGKLKSMSQEVIFALWTTQWNQTNGQP
jgi:hypothetical protein